MLVLVMDRVKAGLRGELTRWMLEPKTGVFIGQVSAMVREKLWEKLKEETSPLSGCLMIYSTNNEQGFSIRVLGEPKRDIVDFEGLILVRKH